MNFRQLLLNTRIRLGDTLAQRPSDRTLLLIVTSQVQSFLNQANLSAKPWAVDELTLVTVPGVEDYPVGAASEFGKPIQIRTLYQQNPAHIEQNIEFYELGEVNLDWNLPQNYGVVSYDGSPHTARGMAFFRKGGDDQVYVRVVPKPQTNAQYTILYQVGVYGATAGLDSIPILPQHHPLVEVRSAIDALPHATWNDDEKLNTEKREQLGLTLMATEKRLAFEFNEYIKTATVSRRIGWRDLCSID